MPTRDISSLIGTKKRWNKLKLQTSWLKNEEKIRKSESKYKFKDELTF